MDLKEGQPLYDDDDMSKAYDLGRPDPPEAFIKELIDYYNHDQKLEPIQNILDVGCGPGNSVKIIQKHLPSAKIIGVDKSHSQINLAKKKYENEPLISFMQCDVNAGLPGADGSVQLITCVLSIHWLNLPAFFTHCHRVLSPGGVIAALHHGDPSVHMLCGPKHISDDLSNKFNHIWSITVKEADLQASSETKFGESYQGLQLPYNNITEWNNQPALLVDKNITMTELAHFINSLGGLQLYIRNHPEATVKTDFLTLLQTITEETKILPEDKVVSFRVQYSMYACRKN